MQDEDEDGDGDSEQEQGQEGDVGVPNADEPRDTEALAAATSQQGGTDAMDVDAPGSVPQAPLGLPSLGSASGAGIARRAAWRQIRDSTGTPEVRAQLRVALDAVQLAEGAAAAAAAGSSAGPMGVLDMERAALLALAEDGARPGGAGRG